VWKYRKQQKEKEKEKEKERERDRLGLKLRVLATSKDTLSNREVRSDSGRDRGIKKFKVLIK
jgi:hypothetical protein